MKTIKNEKLFWCFYLKKNILFFTGNFYFRLNSQTKNTIELFQIKDKFSHFSFKKKCLNKRTFLQKIN